MNSIDERRGAPMYSMNRVDLFEFTNRTGVEVMRAYRDFTNQPWL